MTYEEVKNLLRQISENKKLLRIIQKKDRRDEGTGEIYSFVMLRKRAGNGRGYHPRPTTLYRTNRTPGRAVFRRIRDDLSRGRYDSG